ncbi:MAG: acyl-CoA dehydratase activase-related protein [Dehalococcoidales bacterium]
MGKIRIGIPRALLYYKYYPMWQTFFEELGAEVVVSASTTQVMLTRGSARVVAETCLPVKAFLGHVLSLVDKCDYIFIPAIRSVENKVYNCSKFLGLPDMTKAVIPESPPILEIDIDINKGKRQLYQEIYRLGRHFTWNPLKVQQASLVAWQAYLDYRQLMSSQKLTPPEAIERITGLSGEDSGVTAGLPDSPRATIALIGHPYLLYDEYINHRLVHRLEQTGSRVVTPEMVPTRELKSAIIRLTGGSYWTYEEEVVGAGGYYLQNEADGVIGIMAFGCGPDSLMMDTVRRQSARQMNTPFMCLTLEEHTAEAGVVTRLEAFTDMIQRKKQRKKRKETKVCV